MQRNLLLVDDNKVERLILSQMLQADYNITEVDNGKEAVRLLNIQAQSFSAVVLDLVMPDMDGFEVLKQLKNNTVLSAIPIIVVTALDDEDSHEKAVEYGADGLAVKPVRRSLLLHLLSNAIKLHEASALVTTTLKDSLTKLYKREAFIKEAKRYIDRADGGYYVLLGINIENFKLINEQYGTQLGDALLQYISQKIQELSSSVDGLVGRYAADKFMLLMPYQYKDSEQWKICYTALTHPDFLPHNIRIRVGRYIVDKTNEPVNVMLDRSFLAESAIKDRYDLTVSEYTEQMFDTIVKEQQIVSEMEDALKNGEFVVWLQPQYNHATGAIIGAEALVRWQKNGKLIPPYTFIPIFERNGFIYNLDQYMWEQVCILLRKWIDSGIETPGISVNISRRDILHRHIVPVIENLVKKYDIPRKLLRLEITESAFSGEQEKDIITRVNHLIELGYTLEIDDFGSGYSSLNTLKDVNAKVLKLDMKFFENTENSQRSGNIVESVIRMAKWLDMAVIAEGVEDKEQADYLKSLGCFYIQGFYYAKPMPINEFEQLIKNSETELSMSRLQTLVTLDNNEFWNPKSLDTLIFNSYVGGACVFEYRNGKTEVLRINDGYIEEMHGILPKNTRVKDASILEYMDEESKTAVLNGINSAISTGKQASFEFKLVKGEQTEYFRGIIKVIAKNQDLYLCYVVIHNLTVQRTAEMQRAESARLLDIIMQNIGGGVSAAVPRENGVNYIFSNDRFYEMLGYTREQFAKECPNGLPDRIYHEDINRAQNGHARLATDKSVSGDFRAIKRDGSIIWLHAEGTICPFGKDGTVANLAIYTDITILKETEKREIEAAKRFQTIINNVNGSVAAFVLDESGNTKLIFSNDMFYQIFGYTKQEAFANNISVLSCIYPEDREFVLSKLNCLKKEGKPIVFDYRAVKQNGDLAYIRANCSVMSMEEYGDNVIVTVETDITEKKLLAEQLKTVVENIFGGVSVSLVKDEDGEFENYFVNNMFLEIFGYDSAEEFHLACKDRFFAIHPADVEKVKQLCTNLNDGKKKFSLEYRIIRKDGTVRYVHNNVSLIRIFGVKGEVHLSVVLDITEQVLANQREKDITLQIQTILANLNGGVVVSEWTEEGTYKIVYCNNEFYRILGYTKELWKKEKKNPLDVILDEDLHQAHKSLYALIKNGENPTNEFHCKKRDGSFCWIKCTTSMVKSDNKSTMISVITDTTQAHEAEEQIRFLNNSARDILAQPDTDEAINKTLRNLLHYFDADRSYIIEIKAKKQTTRNTYEQCARGIESEKKILNDTPLSLSQYWLDIFERNQYVIIPDSKAMESLPLPLRELLAVQDIHSLVVVPHLRDGKIIGYLGIDNPKKSVDQVNQLAAIADYLTVLLTRRDLIDNLRKNSESINLLMDDTPGGFVRMQRKEDGVFVPVYANDGFAKMLGTSHQKLLSVYGKNILNGIHPEDRHILESAGEKMIREGVSGRERFRMQNGKGEYVWLEFNGKAVRDSDGETYLNVYYTDITEKINEEQREIALLDNLPTGAALYKYNGVSIKVVHINKSYWRLVNRVPSDFSALDISSAVSPDDLPIMKHEIESAIRQKRNINVTLKIKCGENGYKPFRVNASVTDNNDGTYLLYTSYTPILDDTLSVQDMFPIALSTMMSVSDNLSYVKGIDGTYLCCSEAEAKLIGLTNSRDIIGKNDTQLFTSVAAKQRMKQAQQIFDNGKPITGIIEKRTASNGNVLITSVDIYPIRDPSGAVVGVFGTGRDITAQKEKESRLELLARFVPGGLATYAVTDNGIKLIYCNEGYYKAFGYTKEEYESKSSINPISNVYEEDKEGLLLLINGLADNKEDGRVRELVYRYYTKNRELKWMMIKTVLSKLSSGKYFIYVFQTDITEQQEEKQRLLLAEETYRIAANHTRHTIGRYDVRAKTITLNGTTANKLQLPECITDVPYGRVKDGFISKDTAQDYIDFYEKINNGAKECSVTYEKLLPNKGWRWVLENATTVFDWQGKPIYAIVSFFDVTEQRDKETVYNKWQQELSDKKESSYRLYRCNLNKNAGYDTVQGNLFDYVVDESDGKTFNDYTAEFAAKHVASADISNFMRFIDSNTMIAEFHRGHCKDSYDFHRIGKNGELLWTRVEVELVEYPNSTDIAAYIMFEDIHKEKVAELQTKLQAETDPLTGLLNRKAFEEKVNKIIADSSSEKINAFMLMDLDGFKLINDTFGHAVGDDVLITVAQSIRSEIRETDLSSRMGGDEFLVLLKDIKDKDSVLKKARAICERARNSFNLSIPVSLSIGIALSPSDGTDFLALYNKADKALYYVKENGKDNYTFFDADKMLISDTTEDGLSEKHVTETKKLLIVEDNPVCQVILENLFKSEFVIHKADNGREALIYMHRFASEIAIVLLDLRMPDMDGFAVLENMKKSSEMANIPTIVVSGQDDREIALAAIRAGAFDFVTKPIEADTLRERIKAALKTSSK